MLEGKTCKVTKSILILTSRGFAHEKRAPDSASETQSTGVPSVNRNEKCPE